MNPCSDKPPRSLISICVPIYNGEKTLRRCVNSILAQTYDFLEIILVDDGSTDNSLQICREFAAADPRIRIVSQKNSGVSAARNAAINASHGEYVAFVDADDRISPDMYRTLYEDAVFRQAQLVFCNFVRVKGDRQIRRDQFHGIHGDDPEVKLKLLAGIFSPSDSNIMGSSCTLLISGQLLSEYSIRFDERVKMSEDMLFLLHCLNAASRISVEKEFLYYYWINQSSATQNYIVGIWTDMMAVIDWSRENIIQKYAEPSIECGIQASTANALVLAASNSCKRGTPMRFRQRVRYCRDLKQPAFVREAVRATWKKRSCFRKKAWLQILCLRFHFDWLLILYHSLKHGTLLKKGNFETGER